MVFAGRVSQQYIGKDPSVLKFSAKLQFNSLTRPGLIAKVTQAFSAPFPCLSPNDIILHRALGELFTQSSKHRQMQRVEHSSTRRRLLAKYFWPRFLSQQLDSKEQTSGRLQEIISPVNLTGRRYCSTRTSHQVKKCSCESGILIANTNFHLLKCCKVYQVYTWYCKCLKYGTISVLFGQISLIILTEALKLQNS